MIRRDHEAPRGGVNGASSKAEYAYAELRRRIVEGEQEPGTRLVIEQIARQIGISVVPVREAMRRLEAEGYVDYTRNVGATVAGVDLASYPDTVQTLAVLEAAATGLAVAFMTKADIRRARKLNWSMRSSIEALDPAAFTATNKLFHQTLFGRCPNKHLLALVVKERELLGNRRRSAFMFVPERALGSVAEHEQLLQLIEEPGQAAEVEAFTREHKMRTARDLLAHVADEARQPGTSSVVP